MTLRFSLRGQSTPNAGMRWTALTPTRGAMSVIEARVDSR